jgi:hypothetical protein
MGKATRTVASRSYTTPKAIRSSFGSRHPKTAIETCTETFAKVSNEGAGPLDELLNSGWAYHDKESERLARELEAAADNGVASDLLAPFLHLSTHTIGEHLGDWARALELGRRVLEGRTPTPESAKAWGRLYVAAVLAGESMEAMDLELSYLKAAGDEVGAALLDMRFMMAGALVASKRVGEGARLFRAALDLVTPLHASALLERTIAVGSNNLGWELFETASRATAEDELMQLCAQTSLRFWLQCGNWINTERAHYLNAVVANATGDPASALAHADAALAIIAANNPRPLDSALLQLARAVSFDALGKNDARARAIDDADAAASTLTDPNLKAQFAAERSKIADAARAVPPPVEPL